MSGPWSAEQREWLQALGLPALVLATDGRHDPGAGADASGSADGGAEVTAVPAVAGFDSDTTGSSAGNSLHRALLKATGRTGPQAEQMLRELGVGIDDRMDAAAKRALWTRLRPLRGHRPA